MIRVLLIAALAAGAAIGSAQPASADDRWVDTSTPGLQFGVVTNQSCNNWRRFTYGVSPSGKPMACVSFDGERSGQWSDSASVVGVRRVGGTLPGSRPSPRRGVGPDTGRQTYVVRWPARLRGAAQRQPRVEAGCDGARIASST